MKLFVWVSAILLIIGGALFSYQKFFEARRPDTHLYCKRPEGNLYLQIYHPKSSSDNHPKPCVIFFFGGGWERGTIFQFEDHARWLAKLGIVAITADYRTLSRHNSTPFDSVEDAREAIKWVRERANELNINPGEICVAGGSSGGHLAACCAIVDPDPASMPNRLILMGTPLDLNIPVVVKRAPSAEYFESLLTISPIHQLKPETQIPPTLILHGTNDEIVPLESVEGFNKRALKLNSDAPIQFVRFIGRSHEFYLLSRSTKRDYKRVMDLIEGFLIHDEKNQ